ncbi:hypothetical protein DICPUDRAFT_83953 [Dictyostelium purpureum]|uniref:CRC domain-containing protein n=1 Tax=Dictyostelium purpureum TaxID=5786 RepID=F1A159_DICPU|nr:uncharacterized protein DICPUDRAFT_83953 [Dictyostelium purpureum]EGC30070.1 hypothetical protein DICPUDRAFT_83953 [Dictyostelium purpureum]|eukprot:XP_003293400.1 hypothetical protein DICPUDRAFT_83953 [Dictyostelium purpureum]
MCHCKVLNCSNKKCSCKKKNKTCDSTCSCPQKCQNRVPPAIENPQDSQVNPNSPEKKNTLKYGVIYDDNERSSTLLFNMEHITSIENTNDKKIDFSFVTMTPISSNKIKDIIGLAKMIKEASTHPNVSIVFGVNTKIISTERPNNNYWKSLIPEELKGEIKELQIPILLIFYRWGSQKNLESIDKIVETIEKSVTQRTEDLYIKGIEMDDNQCIYPYGLSREFLHKHPAAIEFQNQIADAHKSIVYVHSQDSDLTGLSLEYEDPFLKKLQKNPYLGLFYDNAATIFEKLYTNNGEYCLVYGGAYNFFNCKFEEDYKDHFYPTNLAVSISNNMKKTISKISPMGPYFSECNLFYLSSCHMKDYYKKKFIDSKFGNTNESKNFLKSFFASVPVEQLKNLMIYDPDLTVSTSPYRPGKERDYFTSAPAELNKETYKLIKVKISSLNGASQTICRALQYRDTLLGSYRHFKNLESLKRKTHKEILQILAKIKVSLEANYKDAISGILRPEEIPEEDFKMIMDITKEIFDETIELYKNTIESEGVKFINFKH